MAVTLAERIAKHQRRQAALDEKAARLKEQERKARTRQLISAGGLVEKAGLLKLPDDALYGALLSLERGAADPKTVEQWKRAGRGIEPVQPEVPLAAE